MSDFTFRLRFNIPKSAALDIQDPLLDLSGPYHPSLSLIADEKGKPIKDAKSLALKGSGHQSEMDAFSAGEALRDALTLALAHCRIGADFGERAGRGGFTNYGLHMLEKESGSKILNEIHGLMVYATDPPPMLAKTGYPTLTLATSANKFAAAFINAARSGYMLSDRERLSYSLFTSSFFEQSQDARLLFLVMSVEVLLDFKPRPAGVAQYVESLIALTKNAHDLPSSEKDSILGALQWLRSESIRQASRRLIASKLGEKLYGNQPAPQFFLQCYNLRSALVHGNQPYPTREEIGSVAANLEILVANLLAASIDWAEA